MLIEINPTVRAAAEKATRDNARSLPPGRGRTVLREPKPALSRREVEDSCGGRQAISSAQCPQVGRRCDHKAGRRNDASRRGARASRNRNRLVKKPISPTTAVTATLGASFLPAR